MELATQLSKTQQRGEKSYRIFDKPMLARNFEVIRSFQKYGLQEAEKIGLTQELTEEVVR